MSRAIDTDDYDHVLWLLQQYPDPRDHRVWTKPENMHAGDLGDSEVFSRRGRRILSLDAEGVCGPMAKGTRGGKTNMSKS